MDEYESELECPMCDTYVELTVTDDEEKPANCPMCGIEAQWESVT